MSRYKCSHCGRSFDSKHDANYHSCAGSPSQSDNGIVDFITGAAIASTFMGDSYSSDSTFDSGTSSSSFDTSSDMGGGGDFGGGGSSDSF